MYSIKRTISLFCENICDSAGPVKSLVFLLLLPFILTIIIALAGFRATSQLLSIIIPSISILIGFSLNTVVIMLRYNKNAEVSDSLKENIRTFSVYSILVGLVILLLTIWTVIWNSSPNRFALPTGANFVSSMIIFFLLLHYLSVILLLPPRVSVIVENS